MWESAASSVPSALEVLPGAAGKVFPGCAATGWAPSPHFSQLGLQSDFLAGFLLFHITTIMNTPTTREKIQPENFQLQTLLKHIVVRKRTSAEQVKNNSAAQRLKQPKLHTNTPESPCQAELRQEPQRVCHKSHTSTKPPSNPLLSS